MAANIITLGRIFLVFLVIAMFQFGFGWCLGAVALTILVLYLDSLDGYVARKLGVASDFGAIFDITGDRIVEHIYLIFYCATGLISFVVPMVFITRSFLVDTLRSVAYIREGKTPFGKRSMMKSAITRFLTSSRFMRALYGTTKLSIFVLLGLSFAFEKGYSQGIRWFPEEWFSIGTRITQILVWVTVGLNIIRGLPVLWDGRYYLLERYLPRELKDEG
ncbi:CDP-alcohol phosphatidyltransferase family protein [bacterium]|nr:CDP-alcohol phosphatidyltransferase family protein [bacterium]